MITDQQKADRRSGIGGSDMPIILGLSSYKTPYELFLEKTGYLPPKETMTSYQYWGHKLELVIVEEFKARHNVTVSHPDTITHPFFPFLRGNLDGFISDWNSVLEAKCASQYMAKEWGEIGTDVIPLGYLVQIAHYCSITNASKANLAVLIGGNDYREYEYNRDINLEMSLIDAAKKFWECVEKNTPPPPINQDDLKLIYPISTNEKKITATQEIKKYVEEYAELKIKINELQDMQEEYKFKIMKYMEDAECLTDEKGFPLATWRSNKKGSRIFLIKQKV